MGFMIVCLVSCTSSSGPSIGASEVVAEMRIAADPGFTVFAWTADGLVGVVQVDPPDGPWLAVQDGDAYVRRDLPIRCDDGMNPIVKTMALDGSDALVVAACPGDSPSGVYRVGLTDGRIEPARFGPIRYGADDISLSPDGDELVITTTSDICGSVRWLDHEGEVVREVIIGEGDQAWSLGDYFHIADTQKRMLAGGRYDPDEYPQCDETGLAGNAAWSSEDTIALLVAPDSLGKRGFARLDAAYELWLMDGDGSNPRRVASDLDSGSGSGSFAWSPNGRCLGMAVSVSGRFGLWIWERESKTFRLITGAIPGFHAIAWEPDGNQIAGARGNLNGKKAGEIVAFESPSACRSDPQG